MDELKQKQKELSQMLGIGRGVTIEGEASWAEIYEAIEEHYRVNAYGMKTMDAPYVGNVTAV